MPFKGFCISCNHELTAETREELGELLIQHHKDWQRTSPGQIINRCNVFYAQEFDAAGKPIGDPFGLDTTMEIVSRSWTGTLWYEGGGRERRR